jgi:hypothetical protein
VFLNVFPLFLPFALKRFLSSYDILARRKGAKSFFYFGFVFVLLPGLNVGFQLLAYRT